MKTKKVLSVDMIIEEVTKMINMFNPTPRDIKSSIDRLLDKDLLARDEKEKCLIKYKN
jgi:hypothetical protein